MYIATHIYYIFTIIQYSQYLLKRVFVKYTCTRHCAKKKKKKELGKGQAAAADHRSGRPHSHPFMDVLCFIQLWVELLVVWQTLCRGCYMLHLKRK